MSNIIEVKNMYKSFTLKNEKLHILKDINLNISRGEFISIMGPSGCGKSTLLYLLGGLDSPSSGNIIIDGKDYNAIKEKERSKMRRRNIGFVFQFYNLVPNLNVEDNILLPLLLDGKNPEAYKSELDEILQFMNMRTRRNHKPCELSGGQQQRVAIARALIFKPDIILADEPIGNLDSKSGNEIMSLFKTINNEMNKTIIQVTHSVESSNYGTRVINLMDGQISS